MLCYEVLFLELRDGDSAPAEITDKGRETMLLLGRRIRHLYVNQLGFLPELLADPASVYLRATPFPRTLTSLQQVIVGLYPPNKRAESIRSFQITTRNLSDETLLPNETHCERFIQLIKAFSRKAAGRCRFTAHNEKYKFRN